MKNPSDSHVFIVAVGISWTLSTAEIVVLCACIILLFWIRSRCSFATESHGRSCAVHNWKTEITLGWCEYCDADMLSSEMISRDYGGWLWRLNFTFCHAGR